MQIRPELTTSHDRVWRELAAPGTWLTGAERVAAARELRAARDCRLCQKRKAALSPGAIQGDHDTVVPDMPNGRVELIHKLVTDPGRITRSWVDALLADGMVDVHYVEVCGLVSAVTVVDTFHAALGLPLRALAAPAPGEPTRNRPRTAVQDEGYVPMIPSDGLADDYEDLFDTRYWVPNVHRAFSLVPDATRLADDLMASHYFCYEMVPRYTDADHDYAIDKLQMELVASRVSRHNDCFHWTTAHAGLLRAGGEASDTDVDVEVVSTAAGDGGVAHGEAILAFVDAAMAVDPSRTTDARERLIKDIGDAGVVDVAAVTAMFQLNTRAADSAGIAVEEPTIANRSDLGARLGFAPRTDGMAP